MNYFLIGIRGLVLVHKHRNLSQKSWKLILRTFILLALCGQEVRLCSAPSSPPPSNPATFRNLADWPIAAKWINPEINQLNELGVLAIYQP